MKHKKTTVEGKLMDYVSIRLKHLYELREALSRGDINDDVVHNRTMRCLAQIEVLQDVRDSYARYCRELEKHGELLPLVAQTKML